MSDEKRQALLSSLQEWTTHPRRARVIKKDVGYDPTPDTVMTTNKMEAK